MKSHARHSVDVECHPFCELCESRSVSNDEEYSTINIMVCLLVAHAFAGELPSLLLIVHRRRFTLLLTENSVKKSPDRRLVVKECEN